MDRDKINKLVMNAINSPLQRAVIGVGVVILAYLFFQLMLGANLKQVDSLTNQLSEQQKLLIEKKEAAKLLPAKEESLASWQEKVKEVNKKYFTELEAQKFIDELPKIITTSGNTINYIKPYLSSNADTAAGPAVYKRVDISLKGTYINLIALFESFKKYGKLVVIESLRVGGEAAPILGSSFGLKYYVITE